MFRSILSLLLISVALISCAKPDGKSKTSDGANQSQNTNEDSSEPIKSSNGQETNKSKSTLSVFSFESTGKKEDSTKIYYDFSKENTEKSENDLRYLLKDVISEIRSQASKIKKAREDSWTKQAGDYLIFDNVYKINIATTIYRSNNSFKPIASKNSSKSSNLVIKEITLLEKRDGILKIDFPGDTEFTKENILAVLEGKTKAKTYLGGLYATDPLTQFKEDEKSKVISYLKIKIASKDGDISRLIELPEADAANTKEALNTFYDSNSPFSLNLFVEQNESGKIIGAYISLSTLAPASAVK